MSPAKIRVTKLAHVHYQHPDLEKAAAFLLDFGMIEERRTSDTIYFRGYDEQPYLYVAEQSKDGKRHFLGGYWVVDTWEDLEKAASLPNASEIQVNAAPGGGRIVTAQDPHGNKIGFVYGQELRIRDIDTAKKSLEKTPHPIPNEARTKVRRGEFRRFEQGPSLVHKAGHYGFGTTPEGFEELRSWYTTNLNLVPTDSIFNPETGKDESAFFHIDLGSEFTDHHSFFLGADPKAHGTHVHHSSFEVNDFDTQLLGHYWLQSKGWTNCWGVGRHVLGSQIFDYWFDASGNIIEHYSDGDLVNQDTIPVREPASPNSTHIWGPNLPLGLLTGRVEDAGKRLVLPPNPLESTPAQFAEA